MKDKTPGFLLVQFTIVLLILSVIATLTFNYFSSFERFIIQAELEKIAMLCFFLQHQAIAANRETLLSFNTATNSYTHNTAKNSLSLGVNFDIMPNTYGPPSNPTKLLTTGITFDNNSIRFFPDGSMSAGAIYLTDKNKRWCYALTSGISHITYLRKYSYQPDQKKWLLLS